MKVIDYRDGNEVVAEGGITKTEQRNSDSVRSLGGYCPNPVYGVFTKNGYLYLLTKTEIEELYKAIGG